MINFKNWRIKIHYIKEGKTKLKFIDEGRVHFNHSTDTFEIYLGVKPRVWNNLSFTKRDMPLMEYHELAHANNLIEGIEKATESLLMVIGDSEKEKERLEKIIKSEILAWRRAIRELRAETNIAWLEKAQTCLNEYVWSILSYNSSLLLEGVVLEG